MATLEEEIKDLKEKNNELAQKVQYWKMTAAQKENEKLSLMKEINELRLKLSRLRSNGGIQARKLDAALQAASEKAISHLVKASAEIASSMEIAKEYIRDRQEQDAQSPRWSSIGGTPTAEKNDKVNIVLPMMMGGQPIQPVVALSRTLDLSSSRVTARSPSQNRSLTERAVPMHMLQDVYIPLTRIDAPDPVNNNAENDTDENPDDSTEQLGLDNSRRIEEREDYDDMSLSENEDFEPRKLHSVSEENLDHPDLQVREIEPIRIRLHLSRLDQLDEYGNVVQRPVRVDRSRDNPLEGPSWLLDSPTPHSPKLQKKSPKGNGNLEPDSTTELDDSERGCVAPSPACATYANSSTGSSGSCVSPAASPAPRACEFSPTVRRRKRTSSPPSLATPRQHHYSPRPPSSKKNSGSGRVLKVVLAKMRLDGDGSPPKRALLDAPSPNGATDAAVIVSDRLNRARDSPPEALNTHRDNSPLANQNRRTSRVSQEVVENIPQTSLDARLSASQESHNSRISQEVPETSRSRVDNRVRLTRESLESHRSRMMSQNESRRDESRDSDSSGAAGDGAEGRTRRPRKMVTYKEKPLNRKLRR